MKAITNYPEWSRAFKLYAKARPTKTVPEIINRVGQKACWRALKLTPKAQLDQWPIDTESRPKKGNDSRGAQLYFALASKKGYRKGGGIRKAATKIYSRRRSAKGAIAAGFFNSIKALGGSVKMAKKFGGDGSIKRSYGKPARRGLSSKKVAISANLVDGAGVVAKPAMDEAIREQIADMQRWAIKELQKADNKFSARRR